MANGKDDGSGVKHFQDRSKSRKYYFGLNSWDKKEKGDPFELNITVKGTGHSMFEERQKVVRLSTLNLRTSEGVNEAGWMHSIKYCDLWGKSAI